ncbi:hypothetical protein ACJ41O_001650 [Fusarium nematophilum]
MADIPNRGPQLLAVNIFFLVTALISMIMRCYVRSVMVKAFGIDDWLMVAGTVIFTLYASFSSAGVHYGTGRHHDDLEKDNVHTAMMCWWFCYLWYALAMVLSKISIGWFLLRVTTSKVHRWIIYIAMLSTAMSGMVFFFVTLFQCRPIPYFWNKDLPGKCINPEVVIALATVYSVSSVISDFIFAILPGLIIWKLQLHQRTKILLIPLLAMGCVASSAVVARFPYLPKLKEPDFLWNTLDIAIWSTVEQGLAITAGSLATLRPLLKLAAFRLGLTSKPISHRPSDYGLSNPNAPASGTGAYFGRRDAYTLSSIGADGTPADTREPKTGFNSTSSGELTPKYGNETNVASIGGNDSEEELRSADLWRRMSSRGK